MKVLRALGACFLERGELLGNNVTLAAENKRLAQENAAAKVALRHAICARDDALSLACDLRADLAAMERQVAVLMDFTPTDLRAIDIYDQEGEAG